MCSADAEARFCNKFCNKFATKSSGVKGELEDRPLN